MNKIAELAEELGWAWIRPGETSHRAERTVIVVVPQWSEKDHNLLRELDAQFEGLGVQIVDLDDLVDSSPYAKVLPGVDVITQTPAIVLYEGSELVDVWEGPDGVREFARILKQASARTEIERRKRKPCQHHGYIMKRHPDGERYKDIETEQPWCPACDDFVEL